MAEWVFQCRIDRHPLHEHVAQSRQGRWHTPHRRSEIHPGDRAWIAVVGAKSPGVYYVATLTSSPYLDDVSEDSRWRSEIHFDYRIDPPLLRRDLLWDPVLGDCGALAGFQGSMRRLTDEQGERLWELAQGQLQELPS